LREAERDRVAGAESSKPRLKHQDSWPHPGLRRLSPGHPRAL